MKGDVDPLLVLSANFVGKVPVNADRRVSHPLIRSQSQVMVPPSSGEAAR